LNFKAFEKDVDEVVSRTLAENIWMINVGSQLETSKKATELAEKYSQGVFAAIGLHPIHATGHLLKNKLDPEELTAQKEMGEFNIDDYRQLVLDSLKGKIVAIGEIGLDYYYKPKTKIRLEEFKNLQKDVLLKQLDLAQELKLPIIFHCRSAHQDLIEILKLKRQNSKLQGVLHCFTGDMEQAKEYLDLGLSLGFNGIIFKSIPGTDWQEIISKTPLDRILTETDAPYLTPLQEAGKRNEPIFVKHVVQEIAKIKKLSYEEIAIQTTKNAKTLFNI